MSKNILGRLTLVLTIAVALFLSGCGGNSKEQDRSIRETEDMVTSHSSSNCHDIIEALKSDTDLFRDGAEQNDDLTMLAVRVSKS